MDDGGDNQLQQLPHRIKKARSRETFQDSQSVPILPTETIVEILLRLPVESLLRCRSVCKLWCSLISDPHFVKSHLSLSTTSKHYDHHRLCLSTSGDHHIPKICHLYDVLCDNPINYVNSEVDYPFREPPRFFRIVGSCNGLLCICISQYTLFIWNPSTRKSNNLPHPDHKRKPGCPMYGFGYDESTDDYKVVEIYRFIQETVASMVNIYSLKTGIWKEIDAFPDGIISLNRFGDSLFLNGALHWFAMVPFQSSYSMTIISLDLAKETYGEVLQPEYSEGAKVLTLGVLKEWLCVNCNYGTIRLDLWVMKVYGAKESWTKFVSFACPSLSPSWMPHFSEPLWILSDGKILLRIGEKMIVYDSKMSSFLDLKNVVGCFKACSFVESLVSPIPSAGVGDRFYHELSEESVLTVELLTHMKQKKQLIQ